MYNFFVLHDEKFLSLTTVNTSLPWESNWLICLFSSVDGRIRMVLFPRWKDSMRLEIFLCIFLVCWAFWDFKGSISFRGLPLPLEDCSFSSVPGSFSLRGLPLPRLGFSSLPGSTSFRGLPLPRFDFSLSSVSGSFSLRGLPLPRFGFSTSFLSTNFLGLPLPRGVWWFTSEVCWLLKAFLKNL